MGLVDGRWVRNGGAGLSPEPLFRSPLLRFPPPPWACPGGQARADDRELDGAGFGRATGEHRSDRAKRRSRPAPRATGGEAPKEPPHERGADSRPGAGGEAGASASEQAGEAASDARSASLPVAATGGRAIERSDDRGPPRERGAARLRRRRRPSEEPSWRGRRRPGRRERSEHAGRRGRRGPREPRPAPARGARRGREWKGAGRSAG